MRRPPFKIDGRGAALRWMAPRPDGTLRPRYKQGRASYLVNDVMIPAVMLGTGTEFEMRLGTHREGRPWHPFEMSRDEARDILARSPLLRGRVALYDRGRAERIRRGWPVLQQRV